MLIRCILVLAISFWLPVAASSGFKGVSVEPSAFVKPKAAKQIADNNLSKIDDEVLVAVVERYIDSVRQDKTGFLETNDPLAKRLLELNPRLHEVKVERGLELRTVVRVLYSDAQNREFINQKLLKTKTGKCFKMVTTHE